MCNKGVYEALEVCPWFYGAYPVWILTTANAQCYYPTRTHRWRVLELEILALLFSSCVSFNDNTVSKKCPVGLTMRYDVFGERKETLNTMNLVYLSNAFSFCCSCVGQVSLRCTSLTTASNLAVKPSVHTDDCATSIEGTVAHIATY